MLYAPTNKQKSLRKLNFYNQVKKVIIRSGGAEKSFNLRIFVGLIRQIRTKFNLTKLGLVSDKVHQAINQGLHDDGEIDSDIEEDMFTLTSRKEQLKQQRIE